MTAVAGGGFRIASLQKQSRFLIALLFQVMEQTRVCASWQLVREGVNSGEHFRKIWFRARGPKSFDRSFQFNERRKKILLD